MRQARKNIKTVSTGEAKQSLLCWATTADNELPHVNAKVQNTLPENKRLHQESRTTGRIADQDIKIPSPYGLKQFQHGQPEQPNNHVINLCSVMHQRRV